MNLFYLNICKDRIVPGLTAEPLAPAQKKHPERFFRNGLWPVILMMRFEHGDKKTDVFDDIIYLILFLFCLYFLSILIFSLYLCGRNYVNTYYM